MVGSTIEEYNFWYTLGFLAFLFLGMGAMMHPLIFAKAAFSVVATALGLTLQILLLAIRLALFLPRKIAGWLKKKKRRKAAQKKVDPEPRVTIFENEKPELGYNPPRLVNGEARRLEKKGED
ncbi:hypothetical protein [Thioalkalivibrio sp. ALE23]|uniref:hypothetical protein n=1 Tax=Thioalkalivibrio sp. ALE23 TaxID=1265495 RepID=UPI00036A16B0|nr:hypothetical protein [Thioalkalivibrio sp. ALE23]